VVLSVGWHKMTEIEKPQLFPDVHAPDYVETYCHRTREKIKNAVIMILALIGSLALIAIPLLAFARSFGLL
jgi:hypothetical protein